MKVEGFCSLADSLSRNKGVIELYVGKILLSLGILNESFSYRPFLLIFLVETFSSTTSHVLFLYFGWLRVLICLL